VLTSDQKGAIAEARIACAALELGITVSRPLSDARYDLVFDFGDRLTRVQCKWANLYNDVIIARCYRARRTAEGCVRRLYQRGEVDAFALYCPEAGACYFLPFDQLPRCGSIQLRIGRTRNNQERRINWAEQFEFAATLGRTGP
jgi:hypothetical protein